ncbi:MAG: TonB-dependent receptor, partial [Candidatus Eremiobacteraeota bacterium]|nr:TonB-dependent receptor [Candidatus Eremiobacteraeota bacterium]
ATLAGSAASDPRYQFGAAGGSPYDVNSCGQLTSGIPNLQTGKFDGIGDFVEPSQLLMHLQLSYQVSKNFSLTANLANIVNTCFGGSNVPWKVSGACGYGLVENGITGGIGNTYNPGDAIQPAMRYAYGPGFTQQPFGVYFGANIGL